MGPSAARLMNGPAMTTLTFLLEAEFSEFYGSKLEVNCVLAWAGAQGGRSANYEDNKYGGDGLCLAREWDRRQIGFL